ncbi:MAG TPA: 16S rRNA (cytidine(1402)-2'-O)-methyltransferase [Paenalcaligenes sp.]|nr:16S rRNA (cytidine(1402)-2'-O)-methyltransferase [Paenalcaligenes sp.]
MMPTGILESVIARVDEQQWPTHCLYVVATPIGNLGDLGLRAWQALLRVDLIAAEDTRTTRPLLQAWGIGTPVRALHRHNEAEAAAALIESLHQGQRIALISDAGAPAISDPGGRVVHEVRQAGLQVLAIPGPSAVTTALMASGVTSDAQPAYVFAGFSPHKKGARQKWFEHWAQQKVPVVFYESPHRLIPSLEDLMLVCGPDRQLTLCRELTKRFEQVHTASLAEMCAWVQADKDRQRGEFVLLIHPQSQLLELGVDAQTERWLAALLTQLSVRDAVRLAVQVTGLSRQLVYDCALRLRDASGTENEPVDE